jgi:hypothetical protein
MLPVALAPGALALGRDNSTPVPFLPILPGFACSLCRFFTISRNLVRQHVKSTHQLQQNACTNNFRLVQLQSWYTAPRARYWSVQAIAAAATATATAKTVVAGPTILAVTQTTANILEQLELEEAGRLEQLEHNHLIANTEVKGDETTPW